MPRTPRTTPTRARRHTATTEDVTQMWTLRMAGYTWIQIAQALSLSLWAITQARTRGVLAKADGDTP